ncbi:hypothetical protein MLD52_13930 [Puniceicoccaceae bacterium K14]|nr:hypothetical protein [Puniceicoccaceae bacterium K14]
MAYSVRPCLGFFKAPFANYFRLFLLTIVTNLPSIAQTSIDIVQYQYPETLLVDIDSGNFDPTEGEYFLQFRETLENNEAWLSVTNAQFIPQGGDRFQVITDDTFLDGFYRVVVFFEAGPVIAEFSTSSFELTEGNESNFALVKFSSPFTGILNYTVEGSASPPDYEELTGSLQLENALEALIEIRINDDETIDESKFVSLTLSPSDGVSLGSITNTLVTFQENDSVWLGSFFEGELEACFNVLSTEANGEVTATLSSDGNGVIPSGDYTMEISTGENSFEASVSNIIIPESESFLNKAMSLSIEFAARNGVTEQEVSNGFVQGIATLTTAVTDSPHLETIKEISFFLKQKPTRLSEKTAPLSDN